MGPSQRHGGRRLAIMALVSPFNSPTHRVTVCLSCLVAWRSRRHCPTAHAPLSPRRTTPGALACSVSVIIPSLIDASLLVPPRSCPHTTVPSSCLGRSMLSRGRCPQHSGGSTSFLPFKITSSGFTAQFPASVGGIGSQLRALLSSSPADHYRQAIWHFARRRPWASPNQ